MDLYVYYKASPMNAAPLQTQVGALQKSLREAYGIHGTLKKRLDEKKEWHTWMEIYPGVPEGFDLLLQRAVCETGLVSLIDGERYIEYFSDAPSCA